MFPDHSRFSWGRGTEQLEGRLLFPLLERERAVKRFPDILQDPVADRLLRSLTQPVAPLPEAPEFHDLRLLIGTTRRDAASREFLRRHPEGVVVELRPGLDTAFWRVAPEKAHWYVVDSPGVLAQRKMALPSHPRLHAVTGDVRSRTWMAEIHDAGAPVLVIATETLRATTHQQVGELMRALRARFPGCQVIFEAPSKLALKRAARGRRADSEAGVEGYWVNAAAAEASSWEADAWLVGGTGYFSGAALPRGVSLTSRARARMANLTGGLKNMHVQLGERG